MRILLSGGAGFIGSHVAEAYLDQGHEVVVLDDLSTGTPENLPPGAELVVGDVTSPEAAKLVLEGRFDVINHHAAQVSVPASVADPLGDAQVNVLGTLNLLEAGAKAGVKRFIFISSGGAIYGEMSRPATEQTPPAPMSPYAVAKLAAEEYAAYYARAKGMEVVVLRYANVYGPRQVSHAEAGVVAIFMDQLIRSRPCTVFRYPDTPEGMVRDYVYVADCARANILALEGPPGTYNISTGVGTTTLALYRLIAAVAGAPPTPAFGPARPGDIRYSVLNPSLARARLGWEAHVGLKEGIEKTWRWRVGQEEGA